jgi:branched-chain amino acid transport system permease protein
MGALVAGLALSVVLTYRGAGVINLAAGAVAVLGAYVFYGLRTGGYLFLPPLPFVGHALHFGRPWSTAPAFVVALAVCAFTGVLLDGIAFRRLRTASPLAKLVATLGLLLTIQAIILLRFGPNGNTEPAVLSQSTLNIVGTAIPSAYFVLSAIVIVASVCLWALYRWSRFGIATRAAQESERMAALYRLSPGRLSMINTVLASVIAGAVGILAASTTSLDSTTIPLAVIPAVAAALLGGFTSFSVATGAGLAIGVLYSLVTWLQSYSWFPTAGGAPLPGVGDLAVFLIIALGVAWRGKSLPERGTIAERRLPSVPLRTQSLRGPATVTGACALLLLVLPAIYRLGLINTEIGVLACLGLVVVTGFVGQVSLLQVGVAGVTGLVMTKLSAGSGIGFPLAPLIGVAAAVVAGVLAALPALRARGVMLAVLSMAGAVALSNFWFNNTQWGFNPTGGTVSPPTLFGLNFGPDASFFIGTGGTPTATFGLFTLVIVALGCLAVARLRSSELGQRMLAVRSNERAAAAAGISVYHTKIMAYMISAALFGLAGALDAYSLGAATSDEFTITASLAILTFAYIGGITSVKGAVLGAIGVSGGVATTIINNGLGVSADYQLIFGGALLMITIVQLPEGLASAPALGPLQLLIDAVRYVRRRRGSATASSEGR